MLEKGREFGFITEFADKFPHSWLLIQVTAQDPKTGRATYGELLHHNKNPNRIMSFLGELRNRNEETPGLPYFATHALWYRSNEIKG